MNDDNNGADAKDGAKKEFPGLISLNMKRKRSRRDRDSTPNRQHKRSSSATNSPVLPSPSYSSPTASMLSKPTSQTPTPPLQNAPFELHPQPTSTSPFMSSSSTATTSSSSPFSLATPFVPLNATPKIHLDWSLPPRMSGNGIDDDNSDDEDEDERQRAKKRHSLRPSGVDDDDDNDLGNTSNGGSSMDDGGQDVDDNFFDLLQTFASLDFPDSDPQQPEKCPLCPLSFALDEFASHVLECITQLDDIEKEHVLKLDEKMAQEMAGGLPQTIHTSSFSHFSAPSTCKDGANCKRTDSSHFINVSHPKVDCFICGKGYQVYEINAHLNLCLTSSNRPPSSSSASPFASSPSSSSMRPVVNAMTTTPTPTPTAPPVFNFSTTSSSMRSSSVSAFDDDDDDDDNDSKSRANIGSTGTGISNSSASGDSGSSNSLNTRQMKAMAQLLLKEKDKAAPDLHAILDGFSKLGFNKKSLTQQMNESINANTNSTPSKSKDNNDNNDNAERR